MTIDSKPSEGLPTNIFGNTSTEIKPKIDTKEHKELYAQQAKNMVNVVCQESLQIYSNDQDINNNIHRTIKDTIDSREAVRPTDIGYKEIALSARPLVEKIEEKLREVKKISFDNGMEQSSVRQTLLNLIDDIANSNNPEQIRDLSTRAELIFKQNVGELITKRQKVKDSRNLLFREVENNSGWLRHRFSIIQNDLGKDLSQIPVDRFVKQSKTSLDFLGNILTSANSIEFNFRNRIEEAQYHFLESLKKLAPTENK